MDPREYLNLMAKRRKMDLEVLRKSFPLLDGFSAKKLIGGGGVRPIIGYLESNLSPVYGDPLPESEPGGNPSGGEPTAGGSSVEPSSPGGHPRVPDSAWADYFGDFGIDWGNDAWGDGGWGDGGGGGGSGNGPNPGEWENDQNPGGQPPADYSNLEFFNNTNPSTYEHRTYNNTSVTLYGKPDHDTNYPRVIVPPGEYTDVPLDAFKVGGCVYKVTDGYGTLRVYDSFYTTMYSDEPILWIFDSPLEIMQDWLRRPGNPCERTDFEPGDTQWNEIFSPP